MFWLCEIIARSEAATMHGGWMRERPGDYSEFMRARIEGGFFIPATWYIEALAHRGRALADFMRVVFSKCDVLHLPTVPTTAPSATHSSETDPRLLATLGGLAAFTRPFNFLGLPSLTVPCGFVGKACPLLSSWWASRSPKRCCFRLPTATSVRRTGAVTRQILRVGTA